MRDRSGMREAVLEKMGRKRALSKLQKIVIEDRRIELYKTFCYFFLAFFWIFIRNAAFIIPAIILLNILAFVRHLISPDKIHFYGYENRGFPTLFWMFTVSGICLAFPTITLPLSQPRVLVLLGIVFGVVFLVYIFRAFPFMEKPVYMLEVVVPIVFFAMGSIYSINAFYGSRQIAKVNTVVSGIHFGSKANDSIQIPEEDAIDGRTNFPGYGVGADVGDAITIYEREGCLGIKWFIVKFKE